jgi:hypothetical protein
MNLIRPAARQNIWRFREILTGVGITALGLYWIFGTYGVLPIVGYVFFAFGAGLIGLGIQRTRFRSGAGGPGVVQVDEGQISYFGPLSGGIVAIADLERLTLDHASTPAHWVLDQRGQSPVYVPLNATGADDLFDAFATLPGLRTERMLAHLKRAQPHAVVIWERSSLRPKTAQLH